MMTADKPTLKSIKSSPKVAEQVYRPSDFLTNDEMDNLHEANINRGKIQKPFDEVDSFEAEILGRFGWEAFKAYQNGEIHIEQLARYIAAERARHTAELYNLECIIVSSVAGANHPTKHKSAPKSLKTAIDIVKTEYKRAKGKQ